MTLRAGLSTGVGSLPHTDVAEAIDWVLSTHELAYVPQLPRRSPMELMLAQTVAGVAGITLDEAGAMSLTPSRLRRFSDASVDLEHDSFASWRGFLAAAPGRVAAVKWQLAGPVTLAVELVRLGLRPPRALDVATGIVRSRTESLRSLMASALGPVPQLVCLDEPSLVQVDEVSFPWPLETVIDHLSAALASAPSGEAGWAAVHCCGRTNWPGLLSAGPAVLSIPVMPSVLESAAAIGRFVSAGGWIAWGVVPTHRPLGSNSEHWWRQLMWMWERLERAGCDPAALSSHCLLTPVCGLAGHDEAQARSIMTLVDEIGERVQDRASRFRRGPS